MRSQHSVLVYSLYSRYPNTSLKLIALLLRPVWTRVPSIRLPQSLRRLELVAPQSLSAALHSLQVWTVTAAEEYQDRVEVVGDLWVAEVYLSLQPLAVVGAAVLVALQEEMAQKWAPMP